MSETYHEVPEQSTRLVSPLTGHEYDREPLFLVHSSSVSPSTHMEGNRVYQDLRPYLLESRHARSYLA